MKNPIIAMLSWLNVAMVHINKIVFHTEFLQHVIYLTTFTIQIVSSRNYAWTISFLLVELFFAIRNEKERDCWFSADAKYFKDKIKHSSEEILFEIKCISWKLSLEPKTEMTKSFCTHSKEMVIMLSGILQFLI